MVAETNVAKRWFRSRARSLFATPSDSHGQSLLEFVLMLPILIGVTLLTVRVNSAIQISIVNQKYSRAQALQLAGNGAWYPSYSRWENDFVKPGMNRMVLGVSENPARSGYRPIAPVQVITRSKTYVGSDRAGETPNQRSRVRIRNTVELCTPVIALTRGVAARGRAISEKSISRWQYCGGGEQI